jgi:hypothetical protein
VEEVTEGPVQGPKKTKREVFGQEKAADDKDAGDYQSKNP